MIRHELLSPAGDSEKLRAAIRFGADAVYCAGKQFGLRAASTNFTEEELAEAVRWCHAEGKKLYVTVNVLPRDREYGELERYLRFLSGIEADAVIVSDIGVVELVREKAPSLAVHISTQASAVSAAACRAWHKMGASRVVLARELTLDEIRELRKGIPDSLELEAFIHGAMCIAYSGRCLLSNFFTGRDANRGECAQPCRWIYRTGENAAAIRFSEEKRPDQVLTAEEDDSGVFVMSSRDTCMIEHIPELMESGITSFKIEGRVKSAYYAAVTANTYRMAMDAYSRDPSQYVFDPVWLSELQSVSHREYGTGFYFAAPSETSNTVSSPGYIREKAYVALAVGSSDDSGTAPFLQRNKFTVGDRLELLTPGRPGLPFLSEYAEDSEGRSIPSAPRPGMLFRLKTPFPVRNGDILRMG